jgi:hypothetical protein
VLLELGSSAKESLRTLSGGTLEEEEKAGAERPSVVLLRSRTRQPVWNLAKKYGTTVEAIRQANRLEADLAEEGGAAAHPHVRAAQRDKRRRQNGGRDLI